MSKKTKIVLLILIPITVICYYIVKGSDSRKMNIPQPIPEFNKTASFYATKCEHNLKELAVATGTLYTAIHDGNLPESLEEMYFDSKMQAVLGDAHKSDEYFCPLPVDGKLKMYIYRKPPPGASWDFVVLECPNHPKHKFNLRAIGVCPGEQMEGPTSKPKRAGRR